MDSHLIIMADDSYSCRPEPPFQVSDFFEFNDWINHEDSSFSSPLLSSAASYNITPPQTFTTCTPNAGSSNNSSSSSSFLDGSIRDSGSGREKREKVAFKTKSEVEVLDDGFKWRKYGKKMVKNSPNPRNYYRCSVEGCPVKKRVERDNEDPLYVVTTYEGVHNHQGPHQL